MFLTSIRKFKKKIIFFFISKSPFIFFLYIYFSNYKDFNRKNKSIVIYSKSPKFDEEINLLSQLKSYNILFIPISARLIKLIYSKYIYEKSINDYNYDNEIKKFLTEKEKLSIFWNKFFSIITKYKNIKAVVNPNFIYTYLQEFNLGAQNHDLKNITIYKEGINPPDQNNYLIKKYYINKKYNGDFIFFKNNSIKQSFENVLKIKSDKTFVSGLLNIDDFCNININETKDIYQSTLFYSYPQEKKKVLGEKIFNELDIEKKTENFYINFIKITNIMVNKKFIIKLKKNDHYPPFYQLLKKNNLILKNNVSLICNQKSVVDCIKNSAIICSFNSSSLVEALVLKKTIIEPKLKWNKSNFKHNFLYNYEHLSYQVEDFEYLYEILRNNIKTSYSEEEITNIGKRFFGFTNGDNIKRLMHVLSNLLNS